MFYNLYLKQCTYTLLFSTEWPDLKKIATVELNVAPHQDRTAKITYLDSSLMTTDQINEFVTFVADLEAMIDHAHVMTREYYQGASSTLSVHDDYGQELFHTDFESFSEI